MLVCRRPGRGRSTGLCWVVAASRAGFQYGVLSRHGWLLPPSRAGYKYGAVVRWFARQRQPSSGSSLGLLNLPFSCLRSHMGVTGWLAFLHGFTVRILDVPFDTVRMCVAGGMDANVFTCFSVGGTVLVGVTVRLFFPVGVLGDPRFVLNFCLSPGGSGVSCCPAALSLLRGFGAAWSFVLEARAFGGCCAFLCVTLHVDRLFASPFVFPSWSWGLPPSWAGYKYGAHHAGISSLSIIGPGLLVVAAVPGGVKIRGLHNRHLMKTIESDILLVCVDSVGNTLCLLAVSLKYVLLQWLRSNQVCASWQCGTLLLNCDGVTELPAILHC